MRTVVGIQAILAVTVACSASTSPAPRDARPALPPPIAAAPAPGPAPAFYIESLRARKPTAGKIEIGDLMSRGQGFTKYHVAWTSGGQPMTGTISLPDGGGPFPVVIVNHGHIPPERYWIGQDSGIFGDPMAAHGFISIAPNYVGYDGSGPGDAALPVNQQIAVTVMDLISSLGSLPQADASRVAVVGHSQGGGVSEILMVVDTRIKAVVLHAPVSTDEAENAARLHARNGSWPALGDPAQNAEAYRHVSPRGYLAAWQPPVLLVQGTSDHTIPAEHTQATFDALQRSGVRSRLLWIPGADHDLVGADLASAVAEQEAWIRQSL
jgi:dipeptidyl aminopeptidase/acylaminoacyl peptidase